MGHGNQFYAAAVRESAMLRRTEVSTFPTSSVGQTSLAPGRQRGHPHFFIRDPVRADNGQRRKIAVQTLDIGQQPILDVENYGLRAVPCHVFPQFFAGPGYMH